MAGLRAFRPQRPKTLFAKMWHSVLALMLLNFVVHAFLVTGTLQLGSEAQTERRLTRIADHWGGQPPLTAPLRIDPVTVIYPRYELLPAKLQGLLDSKARGVFEVGPRAQDYFVLARTGAERPAFYVVEFHSEVKPTDTIEHQLFIWYLAGITPFCLGLLWVCQRVSARVTAPMRDVGQQVLDRSPTSLAPLTLPAGHSVELKALVEQINSALARTGEVLERERRFTQFASHELRTPVAVMQSALERIETSALPEQAGAVERAHRGLRDMHALVDTFLQLSTADKHPGLAGTTVIDAAWLEDLMLHVGGGQRGQALIVDMQATLELDAPPTLAHVLIGNLLKNALFHGGPGPVRIVVRSESLEVRNSLRDEPGTPGFGLGCQIVRRICHHCGWSFDLRLANGTAVAKLVFTANPEPGAADGAV